MVESRKEKETKNGVARCHTMYIKLSIFAIVVSLFYLLISKILTVPATEKIRTVKQTFAHGSNLVVINHSYTPFWISF